MARRSISTPIWSDPWFESLDPNSKLVFMYLITNEKTNMLGIYEASIKKISNETDISREEVEEIIANFLEKKKIRMHGTFIILVNFLKHQKMNTNMKKSALKTYQNLPADMQPVKLSHDYRKPVTNSKDVEKDWQILCNGFGMVSNHYGMVRKVEVEVEIESEVEGEIEGRSSKPSPSPPLPIETFESTTEQYYVSQSKRINQADRQAIIEIGECLALKMPDASHIERKNKLIQLITKLANHKFWVEKRYNIPYLAKDFEEAWNIAEKSPPTNSTPQKIDYSKYENAN